MDFEFILRGLTSVIMMLECYEKDPVPLKLKVLLQI